MGANLLDSSDFLHLSGMISKLIRELSPGSHRTVEFPNHYRAGHQDPAKGVNRVVHTKGGKISHEAGS